jgi:hypothetical protein
MNNNSIDLTEEENIETSISKYTIENEEFELIIQKMKKIFEILFWTGLILFIIFIYFIIIIFIFLILNFINNLNIYYFIIFKIKVI